MLKQNYIFVQTYKYKMSNAFFSNGKFLPYTTFCRRQYFDNPQFLLCWQHTDTHTLQI